MSDLVWDFSDLPLFQTFTYWREKKLTSSRESVCAPNIHSKGRSKIGVTEDYFCLAPSHEVKKKGGMVCGWIFSFRKPPKCGKHNEIFSIDKDILSISVPLSWKKYSLLEIQFDINNTINSSINATMHNDFLFT